MESIHTDVTKTLEEISRIMQEMDAQKKQDNTDHKESITEINRINAVSYTHLDVYKRQVQISGHGSIRTARTAA